MKKEEKKETAEKEPEEIVREAAKQLDDDPEKERLKPYAMLILFCVAGILVSSVAFALFA